VVVVGGGKGGRGRGKGVADLEPLQALGAAGAQSTPAGAPRNDNLRLLGKRASGLYADIKYIAGVHPYSLHIEKQVLPIIRSYLLSYCVI
jgi:hypothetical protein